MFANLTNLQFIQAGFHYIRLTDLVNTNYSQSSFSTASSRRSHLPVKDKYPAGKLQAPKSQTAFQARPVVEKLLADQSEPFKITFTHSLSAAQFRALSPFTWAVVTRDHEPLKTRKLRARDESNA